MSPSELMAFGDANNDKDMLEFAEHSYVMANSHDQSLFDIAKFVAPSNDEQGVLQMIEEKVLKVRQNNSSTHSVVDCQHKNAWDIISCPRHFYISNLSLIECHIYLC